MKETQPYFKLGEQSIGSIEPKEHQRERLDEITERISSGEFHREVTTGMIIPLFCMDGRTPNELTQLFAPNAAGGTETVYVADDLTTKRFADADGTTLSGYKNILEILAAEGFQCGGHTDTNADHDISGCGANDKLGTIYRYIVEQGDVLREFATQLGLTVEDATHRLIVGNGDSRTQFSKGSEISKALAAKAPEKNRPELQGQHNEVVAVINFRSGQTLDRDALKAEFGNDYQAFNVDVWSFMEAAEATSMSEAEAEQKVVAMVYYNVAAAMVLGGRELRVVVLR